MKWTNQWQGLTNWFVEYEFLFKNWKGKIPGQVPYSCYKNCAWSCSDIVRRPQNLKKISLLALKLFSKSKTRWDFFFKFFWPRQNIWTLWTFPQYMRCPTQGTDTIPHLTSNLIQRKKKITPPLASCLRLVWGNLRTTVSVHSMYIKFW